MKNVFWGILLIVCTFLGSTGLKSLSAQNETSDNGVPVGTIMAWAGKANSIPAGWRVCNGTSLQRESFAELFSAIGTVWGTADEDSFNLPDLRGRFLRGVDFGTKRDTDAGRREQSNVGGNTMGVGTIQEDSLQEHNHPHNHTQDPHNHGNIHGHGGSVAADLSFGGFQLSTNLEVFQMLDAQPAIGPAEWYSGTGMGRTSKETRPKNAAVIFIIKAKN